MAQSASLHDLFQVPSQERLPDDVATELESTMRLHSLSPQELFYKWESYCMKMGSENTLLDYNTARAFKKDIQESLERESRGKNHMRGADKKTVHVNPRAGVSGMGGEDMFGMMGVNTSSTPRTSSVPKRKHQFETPSVAKAQKSNLNSSPTDGRLMGNKTNSITITPFVERQNAGQIIETLNDHLAPFEPPIAPSAEPRVKLVANTEIKKFAYKPLAMHLSEASEILDERIDEFLLIIQDHYKLEDAVFGNAASMSTNEIVAVGRIASDIQEEKANESSLVLETSRRTGAGLRVPLKFAAGVAGEFFPGQIIALRGKNASGDYFAVSEILEIPLLQPATTLPGEIEQHNKRIYLDSQEESSPMSALNVMVSSGPYTDDSNLDYEPLHALCDKAAETYADVLILIGPLLDIEHPLVASGDICLPDDPNIQPDQATLTDAFRLLISEPLSRLAQAVPGIIIILVPSVREAVNKHVSWPQQNLNRKELGLPKQCKTVSNPVTISLNETMFAISAADILGDLQLEEVKIGKRIGGESLLARLPGHVIQQRHFFPVYPPVNRARLPKAGTEEGLATGTPMDVSYLKLAEWMRVQPDVLVLPSALPPFAKVVEGVVVVNPGTLSKRKGPGTYSQFSVYPRKLSAEEKAQPGILIGHKLYERTRVDVVRI